jgi:peroxiredoxin
MLPWKSARVCVAVLVPLLIVAGCSQEPAKPPAAQKPAAKTGTNAAKTADNPKTAADGAEPSTTKKVYRPPQATHPTTTGPKQTIQLPTELAEDFPATMPKVTLTTGHAATCLVKVGDKLPDADLADLDGKPRKLSQVLGSEYTVVMLWKPGSAFALEELDDLPQIAAAYGNQGVKVVGVCVNGTAQQARKEAQEAGVTFPILLDAKGQLFAKVATEKLPRTYLVDSTGKILWFDIEYSRSTRRELRQALRFLQPKDATAAVRANSG